MEAADRRRPAKSADSAAGNPTRKHQHRHHKHYHSNKPHHHSQLPGSRLHHPSGRGGARLSSRRFNHLSRRRPCPCRHRRLYRRRAPGCRLVCRRPRKKSANRKRQAARPAPIAPEIASPGFAGAAARLTSWPARPPSGCIAGAAIGRSSDTADDYARPAGNHSQHRNCGPDRSRGDWRGNQQQPGHRADATSQRNAATSAGGWRPYPGNDRPSRASLIWPTRSGRRWCRMGSHPWEGRWGDCCRWSAACCHQGCRRCTSGGGAGIAATAAAEANRPGWLKAHPPTLLSSGNSVNSLTFWGAPDTRNPHAAQRHDGKGRQDGGAGAGGPSKTGWRDLIKGPARPPRRPRRGSEQSNRDRSHRRQDDHGVDMAMNIGSMLGKAAGPPQDLPAQQ